MAIQRIELEADRCWAIWHITETEQNLLGKLSSMEDSPPSITNPNKRLEWLASRLLICDLMQKMKMNYQGLDKDNFGKPMMRGHNIHVSITHSYPYVAAVIDRHNYVGIDLEQPKEKLLRIAPRVLDTSELEDAGVDVIKHCIFWCAKETLIKVHGKKDLIFSENIKIKSFTREIEGNILGRIIVDDNETIVPLYYIVESDFVLVFNKPAL
jgi:4'-phosphopantetheinyl transferase